MLERNAADPRRRLRQKMRVTIITQIITATDPKIIPASPPADSPLIGDDDPTGGLEEPVGIADTAIVELEVIGVVDEVEIGISVEDDDPIELVAGALELVADPLAVVDVILEADGLEEGVGLSLGDADVEAGAEVPAAAVESPNTEAALDRNGAALRMTSWQSDSLSAYSPLY